MFDLEVGDCFSEIEDTEEMFSSVESVPCSKPHSEEVFVAETLPDGDFPGMDAIDAQAGELCFTGFEEFVGLPFEESVLTLGMIIPSEPPRRRAIGRLSGARAPALTGRTEMLVTPYCVLASRACRDMNSCQGRGCWTS